MPCPSPGGLPDPGIEPAFLFFFLDLRFLCLLHWQANSVRLEPPGKCVLVAQSVRLCAPMDWSPSGSSIHGISQASILEWVAIAFSRGSSQRRNWSPVSCIAGRFFTNWVTREAPSNHLLVSYQPNPARIWLRNLGAGPKVISPLRLRTDLRASGPEAA